MLHHNLERLLANACFFVYTFTFEIKDNKGD